MRAILGDPFYEHAQQDAHVSHGDLNVQTHYITEIGVSPQTAGTPNE